MCVSVDVAGRHLCAHLSMPRTSRRPSRVRARHAVVLSARATVKAPHCCMPGVAKRPRAALSRVGTTPPASRVDARTSREIGVKAD